MWKSFEVRKLFERRAREARNGTDASVEDSACRLSGKGLMKGKREGNVTRGGGTMMGVRGLSMILTGTQVQGNDWTILGGGVIFDRVGYKLRCAMIRGRVYISLILGGRGGTSFRAREQT
eukprot:751543-Hanusia_phi.AAC.1